MKNKKILFIIAFLLCIIPNNVFAFCSSNSLQTYRGYARDVKIKYSLVNNDIEGGNYKLTFSNMNYNIYAKDKETGTIYKGQDENNVNEIVTADTVYQGGKARTIEYYTIDGYCSTDVIYTIKLNIPKYNIYYNTDTCSGINNYEFCNQYIFTDLSNEDVKKKLMSIEKVMR